MLFILLYANEEIICGISAEGFLLLSGGSRIAPRRGRQLSSGGPNIRFCQNFPKTAWNWKNLDPRGAAHPKFYYVDPPLLLFVAEEVFLMKRLIIIQGDGYALLAAI